MDSMDIDACVLCVSTFEHDADAFLFFIGHNFYIVTLDANKAPCGALCDNIGKIGAGNGTSPGIDIIAGGEMKDGRASVQIRSMKVYERGGENGTATFCVTGPSKNLMKTCYTNMQLKTAVSY